MIRNVAILAGGSGTRLWPASRADSPKQFLKLGGGLSLFQQTLERALALGPEGTVLVVSHRDHLAAVRRQWRELARSGRPEGTRARVTALPEPAARNTAPAIALACAALRAVGEGERPLLVLPADHTIGPLERFRADVQAAGALAAREHLVTFGIPPRYPETGYGYIEIGEALEGGHRVRRFREKPDAATARRFLEAGGFFWNSGMFAFRPDTFFRELEQHSPELARPFRTFRPEPPARRGGRFTVADGGEALERVYRELPAVSVDYALMEKSARSAVVPASFDWSDVGSWDEVCRVFGGQDQGVTSVEAGNNAVFSDIPVALAGVQDLIVVVRGGAALVCRKGDSQLVRRVVERLRDEGREELL